ncbi:hypothetical protein OROHE_006157 [Orobanche hederae]
MVHAAFLFPYVPADDGVSFGKQISSPQYEADPSKETKLIRIRVQWLWFVPRNDNPDDFYSMQMILYDEENTKIQTSVPRAQIGKISQTMKEGFLYGLQNYTVGQNVDDFLCTSHPYRLGFHRYTTVKPCPHLEIPRYGFQFVAFEKINEGAMDLKLSVDVIGQMIGAGELVDISKRSGGNTKMQTIHLRMLSENSIPVCTLWGKYAEEISKYLTREEPIVVIMQFARLKNEWTVGNSFNSTRLLIDSDIDEVLEFKKSMLSATTTPMKSLSRIEIQSISTILSELAEESDMKDLIELVGIDKPSKWVVVATIDRLQSRFGWYYNSCQKCLIKAEEIGGSIRYRKCKNTNNVLRFKVGVIAMDNTSSVSLILFDQYVNQILGYNAKDLKEMQGGSEFTFPDELDDLKGTTYLFKFEVSDYNIQSKYHHYTVSKLSKDKDEIESFLARKKSIVGGAMYDGCGDSHATCPRNDIVNESSYSISDNVADTTPSDSCIKRRRLFSHEDSALNTDADWESQHSTNVKDQVGVVKDVMNVTPPDSLREYYTP